MAAIGLGAALLSGIIAARLFINLRSTKKLNEARLRTLLADEPERELFEIDLIKKTIHAYNDFSLFGVNPASIPNPVTLDRLSSLMGFDFSEHFKNVTLHGNTIYKNRFIIYVGGRKLCISESGKRTGHILSVTMSLIR